MEVEELDVSELVVMEFEPTMVGEPVEIAPVKQPAAL
jgi:hypothetical protein